MQQPYNVLKKYVQYARLDTNWHRKLVIIENSPYLLKCKPAIHQSIAPIPVTGHRVNDRF